MRLKVLGQALEERVMAKCLCVTHKRALAPGSGHRDVHAPLVAQKAHL